MSDKDASTRSGWKALITPQRGPDGKRRIGRWGWVIGGVIGLAFGIVPMIRGVDQAATANDPDAQARFIEDRILSRNPPMALVAHHEPALWAETHRKLVVLLREHPKDAGGIDMAAVLTPLNDRIKQGAVRASDQKVAAIYEARLLLMQKLQAANVDACKAYVALDYKSLSSLADDLKAAVRSADQPLYDAYEEGVGQPMPALLTEAQADAAFSRMQDKSGARLSDADVERLGGVGAPAEVCDATIRFTKLLTNAPAAESAPAIRFMLLR